ncbi:DnaJ C-terminal domain-containing protein [Plastoroseomonas arctica]|uniref:J domain-containing protein n=1 Tax=Plastoroseomonas arctica TaxID=1509237 RepID=A0AAF1JZL9_9PROT|nr:J domain-containing protein [Plastoroseomonas arctica]MBR0655913.1 J domain-containing protein [Plastoroseomonas arctica]
MAADPYVTLGVARDASPEDIKKAYKKLARANHPDLHPGQPEREAKFKAVSAANALLSDAARRARFDAGEIDADGQERAPPPPRYREYADSDAGARYGGTPDFDDLFADMFEQRARASAAPRRGMDQSYRLTIPFPAAIQGSSETLTLPGGRTLNVKIPPGVEPGQVLKLRGQGDVGRNNGPAGDALIELDIAPHPLFRRDGADIRYELPVSLAEAVLGAAIRIPTPSGPLKVTLPAASDSGQQIRLRGKGVPAHGGQPAGDLLLTLRVVLGTPDPALVEFLRDHAETGASPRQGGEWEA